MVIVKYKGEVILIYENLSLLDWIIYIIIVI